ncbi:hypothetical protein KAT08_01770 [Candidatus Babeliales bacterium]|nr:hypothetical protein [Candidatus Babeliales bacterium]
MNFLTYNLFFILKKEKIFLILIFLLSFILNFSFFHFFLKHEKDIYFTKDSNEYHSVAVQIAKGNGITDLKGNEFYNRVPGYSLFLSFCYKLFNFDIEKSIYLQIFLSSFISILIFLLSLVIFQNKILLAKISCIFFTFHVGTIIYSGSLMSEVIFMLFFLFFCILFFSTFDLFFCEYSVRFFSYSKLFFAGIFLGIASLIRPVGHFIIVISVIIFLFSNLDFLKKLIGSSFLIFGWSLIIFWWILRNFLFTGEIFFHSMSGDHFLNFLSVDVVCQQTLIPFNKTRNKLLGESRELILNEEKKIGKKLNKIQRCKISEKIAFKYLKKFPFGTIKRCLINILKTLFCFYSRPLLYKRLPHLVTYNYFNSFSSSWYKVKSFLVSIFSDKFMVFLVYYELLWMMIIFLGFFGGIILSFLKIYLLCELLKILPFIFLLLFLTIGVGFARLRFPIEPFLIIFSSYFWIYIFKKRVSNFICSIK